MHYGGADRKMTNRSPEDSSAENSDPLPSTNAMAVLGLLAVAPMTAYAIAEQTRRALGNVWSSSRRLLLGEPRRLAAKGLAESVAAPAGSRAGQQWRATEHGRATLRRWLDSPVARTEINSELVLRLIFADQGDVDALKRQIGVRRDQLREEIRYCLDILDDYVATGGPFPHRLHITTATSQFIAETKLAEHAFLDWLSEEVARWPDTVTTAPERHRATLLAMRQRVISAMDGP